MGYGRAPKMPSYNLQSAVDVSSGLIVHHDVFNDANDSPMSFRPNPPPVGHAHPQPGDPLPEFSVQDVRAEATMYAGHAENHAQIDRSGRARPHGGPDIC